mgnify:CR=1 FL=1
MEDNQLIARFSDIFNGKPFHYECTIWLENGMYYIAHGEAIRETDNAKAKAIIDTLAEYGIDFVRG